MGERHGADGDRRCDLVVQIIGAYSVWRIYGARVTDEKGKGRKEKGCY